MDPTKFKFHTGRFGSTTEDEKRQIIEDKNPKNTKRATHCAVACLMEYIAEKNLDFELKRCAC